MDLEETILAEILAILNSFFFDFYQSLECFTIYKTTFISMHTFLNTYKESKTSIIDMVLRIIKNALQSGIVQSSDFEEVELVEKLTPLLTSRSRITLVAKVIS